MNIHFNFYADDKRAHLIGLHIDGSFDDSNDAFRTDLVRLANDACGQFITDLQKILLIHNKPTIDSGDITPIDPGEPIGEQPIPTPKPVEPPVEVMSTKSEPKYTMEDVRKALIEVKKTKGAEGLKRCFDIIGASSLTAVEQKDYTKLYDLARGELDAK